MLLRIYLSLFLTLCCATVSLAETFVVISNADAGPGTLREALTKAAANGNTEKDYINFNLPDVSEAGRTINLTSDLPDLSSNLSIDGSTQNGAKLGLSSAKVILKTLRNKITIILFKGKDVEQVEFYGLYFLDTSNPCISDPDAAAHTTMQITNAKNIIIGGQNKGNVFNGYNYGNLRFKNIDGIEFADNLFGQSPYAFQAVCSGGIDLNEVTNVNIGGTNKTNTFISGLTITLKQTQTTSAFNIINNYFSIYSDGVTTDHSFDGTSIVVSGSIINTTDVQPKVKFLFRDNLMTHFSTGAIKFYSVDGNINIEHNWFGIDKSGIIPLNLKKAHPGDGVAVFLESVNAEVVIGSENPDDGNKIAYTTTGIVNWNSKYVKVLRNSFKCVTYKEYSANGLITIPTITTSQLTASYIKGLATPGASVDVFASDDCTNCSPETFIGNTIASSTGEWQYNFTKSYTRSIIANAHVLKQSSHFTKPLINAAKVVVTNFDCGQSGKIAGIEVSNTEKIKWINEKGEIVSTELELKNAVPGRYKLIIGEFCTVESDYFTIQDARPQIYSSFIAVKNSECGKSNGSITNLFASTSSGSQLTYAWFDQDGKQVAQTRDITNLAAGNYTIKVSSSSCTTEYGPITIKNTTGPNIDETTASIQSTPCNQSTGGVINLTITGGTGTLKYSWKNAQNQVVATTKDLKNQPAGKYILQVNDDSDCGPVYSSAFEITETNSIIIDVSGVNQTNTTCNNNNGSITGINTIGASTYEWRDNNDQLVGTTLNLSNVGPGKYHLVALNATCSKVSMEYTIVKQQINSGYTSTKVLTPAYCNQDNGSIQVIFDTQQPKAVRWENNSGVTIGHNALLQNLDAGTYQLYVTDDNGCESAYLAYAISRIAPMEITLNSEVKTDDQCTQKLGSIQNVAITGGKQPYTYKWLNSAGGQIASTAALINVTEGTYELQVTDATGCDMVSHTYTIQNQTSALAAPVVASNIQLCGPGQAVVNVANPGTGYTYRIYDSKTGNKVIAEQKSSRLTVNVKDSRSIYISRLLGSCESQRTEVLVAVGVSGTTIPNTITPNGDGINDLWQIKGMENYPAAQVQLFNRNGQKVFESRGYASAFDGTRNGQPLPIGTYFYIINLGSGCNLFSGSLTIIR
ncbi:gliding motility-associated C-terminal domain-containing protein [Mucilaginibacter galii]|uniref:gliding motility-associated C-terminal domain-containing protein n=1 Tax=Mucilaginibacter galii TaxID=2005073 RepID=UPI00166ACFB9|nr:gliding motility-associated C-terminal domain-containing protein [Mucilaginibacter galii]